MNTTPRLARFPHGTIIMRRDTRISARCPSCWRVFPVPGDPHNIAEYGKNQARKAPVRAASVRIEVTQTGQPGPDTESVPGAAGIDAVTGDGLVWLPQTSTA